MAGTVVITGGGGYVGAVLVPKVIHAGYNVRVFDTFWYGKDVFPTVTKHKRLELVEGDIRNIDAVSRAFTGADIVIHLACISNDPSFDMDPALGREINLDAFTPLVRAARAAKVSRFIYASSSSVYGVKDEDEVTERSTLEPLTDYSRFKADCEAILLNELAEHATTVVVRPATVCGVSPRQRLDLIHNILTNHAVRNRKVRVFGGGQKRPGIHVEDMTDLYIRLLDAPHDKVHREVFNAGYQNHTVDELAEIAKEIVGDDVVIERVPTDDNRSYHISSRHLEERLGFRPKRTLRDGMHDLKSAIESNAFRDSLNNPLYFNIKRMQELGASK